MAGYLASPRRRARLPLAGRRGRAGQRARLRRHRPDGGAPELGGRAGFDRLVAELHRHGLGILLDIVPNHLATWPSGPWWGDVLRRGRESRVRRRLRHRLGASRRWTGRLPATRRWEGGAPDPRGTPRGGPRRRTSCASSDPRAQPSSATAGRAGAAPRRRHGRAGRRRRRGARPPALPPRLVAGRPRPETTGASSTSTTSSACGSRTSRLRADPPARAQSSSRPGRSTASGSTTSTASPTLPGLSAPAARADRRPADRRREDPHRRRDAPAGLAGGRHDRLRGPRRHLRGPGRSRPASGGSSPGRRAEGEDRVADVVAGGKRLAAEETFARRAGAAPSSSDADPSALHDVLVDLPSTGPTSRATVPPTSTGPSSHGRASGTLAERLLSPRRGSRPLSAAERPGHGKGRRGHGLVPARRPPCFPRSRR